MDEGELNWVYCQLSTSNRGCCRQERKYGSQSLSCSLPLSTISSSLMPTYSQVTFLRKSYGSRLNVFAPVNDLSAMSKTGSEGRSIAAGMKNDVAIAGGQILGDEYSDHVVKARFLTCTDTTDF